MPLAHPVSLCVFCGSAVGIPPYSDAVRTLGHRLADSEVSVVFGGGKIGLMGVLADAMLQQDGRVIGVIPQFLIDLEVAHHGLSELVVVDSMHGRKAEMASRSDAFVALPGGFGTLEEFFEVLTWLQLGLHQKPCILLNINNFFTPLLHFLRSSAEQGFISSESMSLITICESVDELIERVTSLPHEERFREDQI